MKHAARGEDRRPTGLVRAGVALVALVGLTAGVPVLLYVATGPPLPSSLPSATQLRDALGRPDDGTLLITALTAISWIAWLCFTWAVLTELTARFHGRTTARARPGVRGMQRIAAGLIASITLTTGPSAAAALAVPPPPVTATAPPHPLALSEVAGHAGGAVHQVPSAKSVNAVRPHGARRRESTYRVRQGDTLSGIARRRLGNAARWPRIWRLNAHRRQNDGRLFTSPHRIYQGWRLRIPPRSAPPVAKPPSESKDPRRRPAARPTAEPPLSASVPEAAGPSTTSRTNSPEPHHRVAAKSPGHAVAVISIDLPSGSVVGLAFAAGISTALAAGRLRRRKRRTAPPPASGVAIVPEPAEKPVVQALHREHIRRSYTGQGHAPPSDAELVKDAFSIDVPITATIGERHDGSPAEIGLHGLELALTGPGAEDTARAIVLELLTRADHYRARAVISEHDAGVLFGSPEQVSRIARADLPALEIVPSASAGGRLLEKEQRARDRLVAGRNASDVRDVLRSDPGEVLPTVLVVAYDSPDLAHHLRLQESEAARCGLGVLVIGDRSAATTCRVEIDGRVVSASGDLAPELSDARLFHVTKGDAPELLRIIVNSADLEDQPEADPPAAVPERAAPPKPDPKDAAPPVRLLVLGVPAIEVHGRPIPLGRRGKVLELLIYLSLHPEGATREQICACMWPDSDPGERFHSMLRRLRDLLRAETGLKDARFVHADGDRYKIEARTISVDLWDFQHALASTRAAQDPRQREAALQAAADLVRGRLAEGAGYEWIDEERYPLTRAQADVLTQLAALTAPDDLDRALSALERARVLDPDNEETYCRIIALQLQIGRSDAARRTAKLLQSRLSELGLEPEPDTVQTLSRLASTTRAPAARRGAL